MEHLQQLAQGLLFAIKIFSLCTVAGAGLYFGVMLADRIGSRLP